MRSSALSKALRADYTAARVRMPWKGLSILEPLRGNLCIVLAAPGAGKSALSLNYALSIREPSLIVSLDTDLRTQAIRAAGILSGRPMSRIKKNPMAWASYLEHKAPQVRAYDLNLNTREIMSLVKSETQFWGQPPALTVVDNISNLIQDGGYEEYRKLVIDLHRIARMGDTFVLALHHIKRDPNAQKHGPTLYSGQYSGEQEAEIVLGLWANSDEFVNPKGTSYRFLNVSILKNRNGRANDAGKLSVPLCFESETLRIRDMTQAEQVHGALTGATP